MQPILICWWDLLSFLSSLTEHNIRSNQGRSPSVASQPFDDRARKHRGEIAFFDVIALERLLHSGSGFGWVEEATQNEEATLKLRYLAQSERKVPAVARRQQHLNLHFNFWRV
jgi:hypothetical protein